MKKNTSNTTKKQSKDMDRLYRTKTWVWVTPHWSLLVIPITIMMWYYLQTPTWQKWLLSVPYVNIAINANPYVLGWHLWIYIPCMVCISPSKCTQDTWIYYLWKYWSQKQNHSGTNKRIDELMWHTHTNAGISIQEQ